ncbi:hypothetical protein [Metabacillus sp. FJAT-53654]|uniref:Group-specific protein n=1 Tax=Metabacillus rhizosphaerae TaxID=3117747 RepID=A0ABZ2MMU6_9BACI
MANSCNLDHTLDDVKKKLADQRPFLLPTTAEKCSQYLTATQSQKNLNELFHLLKKYDLASDEEREIRNQKLNVFFQK